MEAVNWSSMKSVSEWVKQVEAEKDGKTGWRARVAEEDKVRGSNFSFVMKSKTNEEEHIWEWGHWWSRDESVSIGITHPLPLAALTLFPLQSSKVKEADQMLIIPLYIALDSSSLWPDIIIWYLDHAQIPNSFFYVQHRFACGILPLQSSYSLWQFLWG